MMALLLLQRILDNPLNVFTLSMKYQTCLRRLVSRGGRRGLFSRQNMNKTFKMPILILYWAEYMKKGQDWSTLFFDCLRLNTALDTLPLAAVF